MTLPVSIMAILSAAGLTSLYYHRKVFRMTEIMVYFMVVTVLIIEVYGINLNLKLCKPAEMGPRFWFQCMYQLIFVPCVTLWLFYSYFNSVSSHVLKIMLTAGWLLGIYGLEKLFQRLGFIAFEHWQIGHSIAGSLAVLLLSGIFILWFRKLLDRQATGA
jgi:hypothetical protein